MTVTAPNLYQLVRKGPLATKEPLTVTYSTTGIDGRPHLSRTDSSGTQNWAGHAIVVTPSPVGQLVTVVLETIPDLSTTTLTLVIPMINLSGAPVSFVTQAVTTVNRTSIGGPGLVKGAVQANTFARMSGTARSVVF
jgi:hypothetical protein